MARIQKITRSDKHHQYAEKHMAFSDAGGMELRDYFAGQVLSRIISEDDDMRDVANYAYDMADWMMAVRDERSV